LAFFPHGIIISSGRRIGEGRNAEYAIRLGRILKLKRWPPTPSCSQGWLTLACLRARLLFMASERRPLFAAGYEPRAAPF
jgi:hypothetical protein